MRRFLPIRPVLIPALAAALAIPAAAPAHLIQLIPDSPAGRLRDRASGLLFSGHPFEHEVLDLDPPESLRSSLRAGRPSTSPRSSPSRGSVEPRGRRSAVTGSPSSPRSGATT